MKNLYFFFIQDPSTDDTDTTKEAMQFINDPIPVETVWAMVSKVLAEIRRTGGRIKILGIMGHGLDDPSGPDDPATFVAIGRENLTASRVVHNPYLILLKDYFQPDALVYIQACSAGTSEKLLQAFSTLWGGVKVVGWTGGIAVCDSIICNMLPQADFHRGITYHGDKLICVRNKCIKGYDTVPQGPLPQMDTSYNP